MFLRPRYLNQLLELKDNSRVKIITGIRRRGKPFILKISKKYGPILTSCFASSLKKYFLRQGVIFFQKVFLFWYCFVF